MEQRVKKWRRTASILHGIALEAKDREECNYQLGKMSICDLILKDIAHEKKSKRETSQTWD